MAGKQRTAQDRSPQTPGKWRKSSHRRSVALANCTCAGGKRLYQIFKDFAGPIATIIAAIAAVFVTGYFAKRQADIAREKLRHDLFEKRYRVFDAARKLLCEVAVHRSVSDDDLRAFVVSIGDAMFLFNDDLSSYLVEIRDRAQKLRSVEHVLDKENLLPVGPQRATAVAESSQLFNWLVDQLKEGLVEKFKPFLKLESLTAHKSDIEDAIKGHGIRAK
jgi:hypothetical protein